jgi:hypothetical protein
MYMDSSTLTPVKSKRHRVRNRLTCDPPTRSAGVGSQPLSEGTIVYAIAAKVAIDDPNAAKAVPDEPLTPWSKRVRWVGGLIQAAFGAFWLVRGSAVIGGDAAFVLLGVSGLLVIGVFFYGIRFAAGTAPRPSAPGDNRIERRVTIATVIEFAAAIILPVIVSSAGHSDWVLPSIAITIGPLLLWLDRELSVPRYRAVGWALTIGPVALVATMAGTALVATTGIAAGTLLLGTALAGFHDLAAVRSPAPQSEPIVGSAEAQQ